MSIRESIHFNIETTPLVQLHCLWCISFSFLSLPGVGGTEREIHESHKDLVPRVGAVIKKRKEKGELEALIKKAERQVFEKL
ncbi:MAG: hypothetical protein COB67_13885 [SAR324 cluster bacterium]|uniref:Uncharacterized protein n=1 Tax=SAR324 cluster bacterium TaxID=2024889 RepID=A0A2A4SKV5_9DELT|nr:MAG: hypothetical protein COB67_13885 [SAR324 cluster bacterium]